jgi:predicted 3-demethylubiquinone-9 3-methyltransferase (glyoxalase superfamily)
MPKTTPCPWLDTQGEEAARFYTSVFPNSSVTEVTRYGPAGPRREGKHPHDRHLPAGRGRNWPR